MNSDRVSTIGTLILAGCAVAVTLMLALDRIGGRQGSALGPMASAPKLSLGQWKSSLETGRHLGAPDGNVVILEFADFECPACRAFELGVLPKIRKAYPGQVQIVFHHWPLSYHRFAYPAARAAECAGRQGRFAAFHDLLYSKQDSLGLKSFLQFARESNVSDTLAFQECLNDASPVPTIERDIQFARDIGAGGTPTVFVNGHGFSGVPDSSQIAEIVKKTVGSN
jgi:protein-disulfide isomerase